MKEQKVKKKKEEKEKEVENGKEKGKEKEKKEKEAEKDMEKEKEKKVTKDKEKKEKKNRNRNRRKTTDEASPQTTTTPTSSPSPIAIVSESSSGTEAGSADMLKEVSRLIQQSNDRLYARLDRDRKESEARQTELIDAKIEESILKTVSPLAQAVSTMVSQKVEAKVTKVLGQMVIPRIEIAVKDAQSKSKKEIEKTIAHQFKKQFTESLAPAFEVSMQKLFTQLADTFDAGLKTYEAQTRTLTTTLKKSVASATSSALNIVASSSPSPSPSATDVSLPPSTPSASSLEMSRSVESIVSAAEKMSQSMLATQTMFLNSINSGTNVTTTTAPLPANNPPSSMSTSAPMTTASPASPATTTYPMYAQRPTPSQVPQAQPTSPIPQHQHQHVPVASASPRTPNAPSQPRQPQHPSPTHTPPLPTQSTHMAPLAPAAEVISPGRARENGDELSERSLLKERMEQCVLNGDYQAQPTSPIPQHQHQHVPVASASPRTPNAPSQPRQPQHPSPTHTPPLPTQSTHMAPLAPAAEVISPGRARENGDELSERSLLKERMEQCVLNGDYEAALREALSAQSLSVVSWILRAIRPDNIFSGPETVLSQFVIISLIQQISVSLDRSDVGRKIEWLGYLLSDLDPSHPSVNKFTKPVLLELSANIDKEMGQGGFIPTGRQLLHTIRKILSMKYIR
eukprot:TRINITY_DN2908_c1_g2_i1.p2 TRINITY_DN2908_c1_g2~~TRINITY_DN2908_c1_g2_i1.p2  ORF type:complete len:684 (+),score=228.42 TRINITY_DN2908_c1_g2_i1:2179-4230(+)